MQHNATVYAHIFLRHHDAPINPNNREYIANRVVYHRHSEYMIFKAQFLYQKRLTFFLYSFDQVLSQEDSRQAKEFA
jgi:hypothetical protein